MIDTIDRAKRRELRRALMGLMAGRLTEEDFADTEYNLINDLDEYVGDEAIWEFFGLWASGGNPAMDFQLWRPIVPARFRLDDAAYRRTRAGRRDAARWVLFLQTDAPLVYPETRDARAFWGGVARALTLGIMRVPGATREERTDWNVWPFGDVAALDAARRAPKFLCGPKGAANS